MDNNVVLVARNRSLVIQEMTEEVLIYDLDANKAHCLNQTAAFVWNACDGKNTVGDIIKALKNKTKSNIPDQLVWLAIDQLNERELFSEALPRNFSRTNRREVLKKIGFTAAVSLPIVASLIAPSAISAQSDACSGTVTNCVGCADGTPCDVDMDTIIGMCIGGACAGD